MATGSITATLFSFTEPYPDFDLQAISEHGKKQGVRLIGHHETAGSVSHYADQMEDAFELYESVGVSQVKTGYVADGGNIKRVDAQGVAHYEWHDGQFMVGEYLRSVTEAAKQRNQHQYARTHQGYRPAPHLSELAVT